MTHDMKQREHDGPEELDPMPPFWRSRAGIYLIVGLVIGGLLLGNEHRVQIFAGNWILWLPLVICVGMHIFMHGNHGGRGSGGDRS